MESYYTSIKGVSGAVFVEGDNVIHLSLGNAGKLRIRIFDKEKLIIDCSAERDELKNIKEASDKVKKLVGYTEEE